MTHDTFECRLGPFLPVFSEPIRGRTRLYVEIDEANENGDIVFEEFDASTGVRVECGVIAVKKDGQLREAA